MKVPFLDFAGPYEELKTELDEAYWRFMRSAWYMLGREVERFEQEFADYCGAKYCVGVGMGLMRCISFCAPMGLAQGTR